MVRLFWVSFAVIAYVYAGYPALLAVWARFRPRPIDAARTSRTRPGVSIVVAARNEGLRLAARIENLLRLDYPAGRRQIIVVSDGSTDETLEVLARYPEIEVVALDAGGKAAALNAGVRRARFNVIVFADARQTFAPDALIELVAPFADPAVGAVTGELLLDCESAGRRHTDRRVGVQASFHRPVERRRGEDRRHAVASTIADGVSLYWRYEKHIRHAESAVGSTLGATGAIYAIRRAHWTSLPPDTILDDVLAPMRAVLNGARVVVAERARAFDRASPDAAAEARRKVRTLAGNYQLIWFEPRLLVPWRNPVWLQFVSHKLGRLLVPYALVTLLASNMALAERSIVYAVALGAQCGLYLLGGYGAWLDHRGTIAGQREARPHAIRRAATRHGNRGETVNA